MNKDSALQPTPGKNLLEWIVFMTGLLLVAGITLYLGIEFFTAESGPPRLLVSLGKATREGELLVIPVTVHNAGQATAEQVHVLVERGRDHASLQTADFTLDFVPRGSRSRGSVTFFASPGDSLPVKARVAGYQRP